MTKTIANPRVMSQRDIVQVALTQPGVTVGVLARANVYRNQRSFLIEDLAASVATASTVGLVTIDINVDGVSILTTKLTIDATELTSRTASTPFVISTPDLAVDAELSFDIDAAGTGAAGLTLYIIGRQKN